MAGGLIMLERVLILGVAAAADVAADQAHAKRRPPVAERDTVRAHLCRGLQNLDQVQVAAGLWPQTAREQKPIHQVLETDSIRRSRFHWTSGSSDSGVANAAR